MKGCGIGISEGLDWSGEGIYGVEVGDCLAGISREQGKRGVWSE